MLSYTGEGIASNNSVTSLDVSDTRMGNESCEALVDCIKKNTTLIDIRIGIYTCLPMYICIYIHTSIYKHFYIYV